MTTSFIVKDFNERSLGKVWSKDAKEFVGSGNEETFFPDFLKMKI